MYVFLTVDCRACISAPFECNAVCVYFLHCQLIAMLFISCTDDVTDRMSDKSRQKSESPCDLSTFVKIFLSLFLLHLSKNMKKQCSLEILCLGTCVEDKICLGNERKEIKPSTSSKGGSQVGREDTVTNATPENS